MCSNHGTAEEGDQVAIQLKKKKRAVYIQVIEHLHILMHMNLSLPDCAVVFMKQYLLTIKIGEHINTTEEKDLQ